GHQFGRSRDVPIVQQLGARGVPQLPRQSRICSRWIDSVKVLPQLQCRNRNRRFCCEWRLRWKIAGENEKEQERIVEHPQFHSAVLSSWTLPASRHYHVE